MTFRPTGVRLLVAVLLLAVFAGCAGRKKKIETASRSAELGRAKLIEGDPEGALADLTQASKLDPKNAEITHLLGMAYWAKGNLIAEESLKLEAEKLLRRSFEQRGEDQVPGEWRNNLGTLYVDLRRWPEATSELQKAVKDPEYRTPERPYNNLAKASLEQKRWDEAVDWANKALRVQPQFCMALINRGDAYYGQNKLRDALEDYLKVIEIEECKHWPEPYLKAGTILLKLGQKAKARQYLQKAIELDAEGPHGTEAKKLLRMMGK